jgi:protein-S-isoprenylcysteine O-methyltransferase Ste14
LLPDFNVDFGYAWWFTLTYALITLSMIVIFGRTFSKRFFSLATSKSFKQKIPVVLGAALFGRALMLYSIFVPLKLSIAWFLPGVLIFVVGAILTTIAMTNFAKTPQDQPATKGIYRISRNPIQLLAIFMWMGVAIATSSWIIAVACLLLAILSYPSIRVQERSCIEKYGDAYRDYMNHTPRYLWLGQRRSKSGE